jgi:benzoylformate decarboxylase
MRGRDVLLDVLRSEGVRHVFGNPGTTELPFVDALADPSAADLHYVLALQEATAVGMADGYAQATGRPAFLNLHTSAGLGNAIGNLTNAVANQTPLVVTAGQQDRRHLITDPLLAGDLTGLAAAVSKWTHEVRSASELGTVVRRAFLDAASPPAGPVFVSIPMDALDEEAGDDAVAALPPRSDVRRRAVAEGVDELAALLAATPPEKLAIVAGDEVTASGAVGALVQIAERLGATVLGSPLHGSLVFPPAHPRWGGSLPPAAAAINQRLKSFERVFLVGGRAFMVYPYTPGPAVPPEVELLQLAPNPHDVGRVHPVVLGLVGDVRATLDALAPLLPDDRPAVAPAAGGADFDERARQRYGDVPMHPMAAVHALLRALPDGIDVVDEAITTGAYVRGFHKKGRYFFCRGGGLGWGMPAALGVSLAADRGPVLCVVGDGSAMYSPQALWTAAHEGLPVVFAVVNNRQYLILKRNLPPPEGRVYPGLDLDQPPVDFVALARSMGVPATLVEKADDVSDAVQAAWRSGGPQLLELPIAVA